MMKKKIAIGLIIFSLSFFLGGIYIVTTVERTISTMENLIMLHEVEILREHLLLQLRRVQGDLYLKHTRYARDVDTVILNVRNMEKVAQECFNCHHAASVFERLAGFQDQIEKYKVALSRLFTISANVTRLEAERDAAFRTGDDLITSVNTMITLTNNTLKKKTVHKLQEIGRVKYVLFILVFATPLLAIGLAFVFVRALTKPVNILLHATRRLKNGDLDHRINGLKGEFGEVAASFNEMSLSLKEQFHKMQRTEQVTAVGQMATTLAHEIKNPLAGIKASMQVLHEELTLPEEDKALLLQVTGEVQRIESLIRSLLNFAKPARPHFEPVEVNHILYETINVSLPNQKGITVVKDFDDHLPPAMADTMQLQQVFLNLLLNAIEAMPEGGVLTVKTFKDGSADFICVEISDTGKGMDEGIMEKIFQPFFTTKPKGTGLGLPITKQLVEQHGGAIVVKNNANGGTTFRIILPTQQAVEAQGT